MKIVSDDLEIVDILKGGLAPRVLVAKIQLTRNCNLRCRKCLKWRTTKPARMSPEDVFRIIDELSEQDCHIVNLVGGEPTIYGGLLDIISYADTRGIKCGITSNGQLIDGAYAMRLAEAGLKSINISLDSHCEEEHDYIVGVEGAWRRSVDAIGELIRHVPKRISRLRVNSVVTARNYTAIADFVEFVHALGVRDIKFLFYEEVGESGYDREFILSEEQIRYFNERVLPDCLEVSRDLNVDTNFSKIADSDFSDLGGSAGSIENVQLSIPCFIPFYRIDIDFLGNVFPCCEINGRERLMGNVLQCSLKRIIESDKFREFKRGLIPPIAHPECAGCKSALDDNVEILKALSDCDVCELLKGCLEWKRAGERG